MASLAGVREETSSSASPARTKRWGCFRWALIICGAAMVGIAFAAAYPILTSFAEYASYKINNLIMPGVHVGPIHLQGLTIEQAADWIDDYWNADYDFTVVVEGHPELSSTVPASQFGLNVNAMASSMTAYVVGRSGGIEAGYAQALTAAEQGWKLTPWVEYDPLAARLGIEGWEEDLRVAAVDATLSIESGEIVQTPSSDGEVLDVEHSFDLLASDPIGLFLNRRQVTLMVEPVPPAIPDVTEAAAEAERILSLGMVVLAYDPATDESFRWEPERGELASFFKVVHQETGYQIEILDREVRTYLEGLAAALGEARSFEVEEILPQAISLVRGDGEDGQVGPVRVRHAPTTYVVESYDSLSSISVRFQIPTWKIKEYNPEISYWAFSAGDRVTIPPKDVMFSLPVILNKRIVISLSEQHMWVYEDGAMIRDFPLSTGQRGMETLPGLFQITAHYENAYGSTWDLWMPHFMTIYQAPQGLENGIHGLPLLSSGVRLWGGVLGSPASFGCVVLGLDEAEDLFYWAEDGVVVEIRR